MQIELRHRCRVTCKSHVLDGGVLRYKFKRLAMRKKQISFAVTSVDNLLRIYDDYPLEGTYLQKGLFIQKNMEKFKEEFWESDIGRIEKELPNIWERSRAEGCSRWKQYVQFVLQLYPYERFEEY